MIRGYMSCLAILLLCLFVTIAPARAQRLFSFADIPCDSTQCDSIFFDNEGTTSQVLYRVALRDSISFAVAPAALPLTVPAGGRLGVSVCFTPNRRGTISDSLRLFIRTGTGFDTIGVRLTGRAKGPSLVITPSALLLFPKTNVGASATLDIVLRNTGDLPYTLISSELSFPLPFRLVTPLPITIRPGDSVAIRIAFEPTASGVYASSINLGTGCGTSIQLQLSGATDLVGTGAVLRLSKAGFNPANLEQTPCDVSRCTDIIFSNVGNAPLNIESMDWMNNAAGYMFTGDPPTPFLVAPNTTKTVQVCLNSRAHGFLRDTLVVKSNNRTSIAFGLVIDVSGSMGDPMNCGASRPMRIEQAQEQAKNFIERTLLNLPAIGIQDQLAVCSYATFPNSSISDINFIFPLTYITDITRKVAQTQIDKLVPENRTPTGEALLQMIDSLALSPLKNRVIVLLTDGTPDAGDLLLNPADTIIKRAQARGIRIFCIGLAVNDLGYLQTLSAGTNGVVFPANDCKSLQTAFETITDLVSRGNIMREPFSIKVTFPKLAITKNTDFDSVYIGTDACRDLTLTNIGEGDAIIDAMTFNGLLGEAATGEFHPQSSTTFPIIIPESGQRAITVCFTPNRIRARGGSATITYNSCGADTLHTSFGGVGFAEANLRISDRRVGPPGSIVIMPIYADSAIGAYGVDSIAYGVRWDKSLLDLKSVRPGWAAAGTTVDMTAPVSYSNFYATVGLVTRGKGLTGGGELALLEFEVLRGDSLATAVELTDGLFEDNNPKAKLINAGVVALDSTCFLSSKPIRFAVTAKVVVGDISPVPSVGHDAAIAVSSDISTSVTLEVYGADGSRALEGTVHQLPSGESLLRLNVARFAPGSYYATLRTESGEIVVRKFVVAR